MEINKIIRFNIIVLILVLLSLNVFAFGISSSWWDGHELILEPGETQDIQLTLQNGGSKESIMVSIEIYGTAKPFVELLDKENKYKVNPDEMVKINLRVKMPQTAKIGDTYAIDLHVSSSPMGEAGGPVTFKSSIGTSVPIIVRYHEILEEPPREPTGKVVKEVKEQYNLFSIIGILLVIAIVIFIFYKLHYKQSETESKKRGKKRS